MTITGQQTRTLSTMGISSCRWSQNPCYLNGPSGNLRFAVYVSLLDFILKPNLEARYCGYIFGIPAFGRWRQEVQSHSQIHGELGACLGYKRPYLREKNGRGERKKGKEKREGGGRKEKREGRREAGREEGWNERKNTAYIGETPNPAFPDS